MLAKSQFAWGETPRLPLDIATDAAARHDRSTDWVPTSLPMSQGTYPRWRCHLYGACVTPTHRVAMSDGRRGFQPPANVGGYYATSLPVAGRVPAAVAGGAGGPQLRILLRVQTLGSSIGLIPCPWAGLEGDAFDAQRIAAVHSDSLAAQVVATEHNSPAMDAVWYSPRCPDGRGGSPW